MPWFAVRVHNPFDLEAALSSREGYSTYLPRRVGYREMPDGQRMKYTVPYIGGILFVQTDAVDDFKALEAHSQRGQFAPFFSIYRNIAHTEIQPITEEEMRLMRLLASEDEALMCEVYRKENFRVGMPVEVTAGAFAGYRGYVRRIGNARRVVVEIEGLCAVALPYIEPKDLRPLVKGAK